MEIRSSNWYIQYRYEIKICSTFTELIPPVRSYRYVLVAELTQSKLNQFIIFKEFEGLNSNNDPANWKNEIILQKIKAQNLVILSIRWDYPKICKEFRTILRKDVLYNSAAKNLKLIPVEV